MTVRPLAVTALLGIVLLPIRAHAQETIFSFRRGPTKPRAKLVRGGDGNLYGPASVGGLHGFGSVFRITPAGAVSEFTAFTGDNGLAPENPLVLASDGNLYGTTTLGGLEHLGSAFRIAPDGTLTTLVTFIRSNGVGWANGVGRIGSILGPVIGGVLIGLDLPVSQLFLVAAVPPLCAALGCFALARLQSSVMLNGQAELAAQPSH